MAPVLPGISDRPDQLRAVVEGAIEAGATHVSPIMLHLRPGVREEFLPWLAEHHPDLVARYERAYAKPYGPASDRRALGARVGRMVDAAGGLRPREGVAVPRWRRGDARGTRTAAPEPTEQLKLL
jgi:DNA repair photolyase